MQEQLAKSLFRELYSLRWEIESKYRELKNCLEIENFNSLKPTCIKKEFYIEMFLYNLKRSHQANRSFIFSRTKSIILILLKSEMDFVIQTIYGLIEKAAMVLPIVRRIENMEDIVDIPDESSILI